MAKKLADILQGVQIIGIKGSTDKQISMLSIDSRRVEPNTLFIALRGTKTDGHKFIPKAVEKGATAVVCETCPDLDNITTIKVENSHIALARIADNFYNNPSYSLKLVGVTGTNGKTTIATTLYNFFELLGHKAGLISTIRYLAHKIEEPATHTTPDAITINRLLRKMIDNDCSYAFMEVSSHALDQHRTDFLDFDGAIFTNLTHDHLDYHKTFKDYLWAKKRLFDSLKPEAFALVNADDKHSNIIVQNTKATVYTYGLKNLADFKAKILEKHINGTLVLIEGSEVWLQLVGQYNISNLLAVYATARLLGIDKMTALTVLSKIKPVEGRFETITHNGITAIVDYAHTPDALENILKELNSLVRPGQKIITVFGAGGNRDKEKRPKMGHIASKLSDFIIITSDNPRDEDPNEIIKQIRQGVDSQQQVNIIENVDRREAIRTALSLARPGDIVLVAGKGHETYQEIQGKKYHFDDREVIKEFFGLVQL